MPSFLIKNLSLFLEICVYVKMRVTDRYRDWHTNKKVLFRGFAMLITKKKLKTLIILIKHIYKKDTSGRYRNRLVKI